MIGRAIRAALGSLALALAGAPDAARAELPLDELQARIVAGQDHFKAGRHREALSVFTEVARLHPPAARDGRLQWNIARCHEELGQFEEAIDAFELAERLSEDRRRRTRAGARVAALRAAHFGRLEVSCPPGSHVRVEGLAGEQPCPARWALARAGSYRGAVRPPGDDPIPFSVTVVAGETRTIRPEPAPAGSDGGDGGGGGGFGPWPWGIAAASVASFGTAAWFYVDGVQAAERARDADDDRTYEQWVEQKDGAEVGYIVSLSLGAALGLTSAALFVLDGDDDTPPAAARGAPTPNGWIWRW